jgi:tetratricopeptide (TPR) repeat protein
MEERLEQLRAEVAARYLIDEEVGSGGMAIVYGATDLKHDRRVALKVLRAEISSSVGTDRFLREIRIAAKLIHPHIVPLYDSGEAAGQLYYVMPYIEGETLEDRLRRAGPLDIQNALQVIREAGSALGHAHAQGIVHRDIKPGNIMLTGGHAVVTDFGIAAAVTEAGGETLTRTGISVGTPHYMSPEQAAGDRSVDARSDEYSLACVLYEMLAGQPPFTGPTAMAVLARHSLDPVPSVRTLRGTVPAALEASMNRALEKVPADRFPTMEQFVEAVTGEQAGVARPRRGTAGRSGRSRISRRAFWAVLAVVALAGALLVGRNVDMEGLFAPEEEQLVAVLDFELIGPDSLAYLTQAIPEFLAMAMTGEAGVPRALDRRVVTRTWDEVQGMTVDPQARSDRVVAQLGATHVLTGRVIRQPGGVLVQADLLRGREIVAQASAVAPEADAIAVAESLGVQLLAGSAGELDRLSKLTSTSTATVRHWLRGVEAFRQGNYREAAEAHAEALDEDSTFVLAAWGLFNSYLWLEGSAGGRGVRLAWKHRDRLPPGDSAMLVVEAQRNAYPEPLPRGEADVLALYQGLVQAFPGRWDAWLRYGDYLWHEGGAYVDEGRPMAVQAFHRAIALDSAGNDEPWRHLAEHYLLTGDYEAYSALPEAHRDSASDAAFAMMDPNRALAASEWEWFTNRYFEPIHGVTILQVEGSALDEAEALAAILRARAAEGDANSAQEAGVYAMNRGRPEEAARLLRVAESDSPVCGGPCQLPEQWLQSAAFVEGMAEVVRPIRDSMEASWSGRRLEDIQSEDADSRLAAGSMVENGFWIGVWDVLRDGDPRAAESALHMARRMGELTDRSRWLVVSRLAVAFSEALLATENGGPDASRAVAVADSVYSMGRARRSTIALQVLLAHLYERIGDDEKALRVMQRVWMRGGEEYRWFLSHRLLSRARLAAKLGFRDEAVQSYEHYLALMSDPEPTLEESVAMVRTEYEAYAGN